MGGRGSGRSLTYCGKATTEESLPLDIRRLQRAGLLTPRQAFSWHWTVNDRVCASIEVRSEAWRVELAYGHSHNGRPAETIRQAVMLTTTPCTLGGRRPWFCCPSCSKRVAAIYGKGRLFACRQCKGLAYASQGEADDDRASRRADGIRKRLGWPPGIFNGPGFKPKGMHGRVYERLVAQHDDFVCASLAGMDRTLGLLRGKLDDIEDAASSRR